MKSDPYTIHTSSAVSDVEIVGYFPPDSRREHTDKGAVSEVARHRRITRSYMNNYTYLK